MSAGVQLEGIDYFIMGFLTERGLDIGAHEAISTISLDTLLTQTGDPAFSQTNSYINLTSTNGSDHVASAGRERDELSIEAEVLLGKVERG